MKLKQLYEVKYYNNSQVDIYSMYTPNGLQDGREYTSTIEIDLFLKYFNAAYKDDDPTMERMEDEYENVGWGDIQALPNFYERDEILGELESKQGWGGHFDETVIGISAKGAEHAKQLAKAVYDGRDEDDGPEYDHDERLQHED